MVMEMDGNEIRRKTRNFVIEYLEGFNEFTDQDKFIEMGIVTNDFVFSLKQFIENEFHITISGEDFYKNNLSINSIGKFIEQRLAEERDKKMSIIEIDRDSLIAKIKSCLVNVVGRIAFEIEVNDDLRKKSFWDELETEFPGKLYEKFKIEFDLTSLKPLTLDTIADYIKHEQASDTRKTRERIRNYVVANCVVFDDEAEFSDQDNFFDFGMVNSLFAMKLVTWLEQQWGIEILNEELFLYNFCSVERIHGFLKKKLLNMIEDVNTFVPVLLDNPKIKNKELSESFKNFKKRRKKEVIAKKTGKKTKSTQHHNLLVFI